MKAVAPSYLIRSGASAGLVEAWSTQRLPYEPKDALLQMRTELRAAIMALRASHSQVLHGVYGSPDTASCDVENVLLYNIGTGSFAQASTTGVRLERVYSAPSPPRPLGSEALHYHRYALMEDVQGFAYWRQGTMLAAWDDMPLPALAPLPRLTSLWYRVRTEPLRSVRLLAEPPQRFGVRLTLDMPAEARIALAGLLKPLLDGIIGAFHAHVGKGLYTCAKRVATELAIAPEIVEELLQGSERAVLGRRQLLWPWRDGVQWNPGDDLAVAIEVLVRRRKRSSWACSGSLFVVQPLAREEPAEVYEARPSG